MAPLQIRPALAPDAATVLQIMRRVFEEYDGALDPPTGSLRESVEDVRQALKAGGAVLAWLDDLAVGCARWEWGEDEMYVGRVAVLPGYRRRGIASAMMRALEQRAADAGVSTVRVGVRMSLPDNVALYRRLGYELIDVVPHPRGPDRIGTLVKRLR